MPHSPREIVVIGLGAFGKAVARELTRVGDRVLGIDIDAKRVAQMADEIEGTLEADASDPKALKQCGFDAYDGVVVAIGRSMDASLLTSLNLLQMGQKNIWVKAQSDTHETLLHAIGVTNIIQPERHFGWRLAQMLHNPLLQDFLSLSEEGLLAQMRVPGHLVGKSLSELNLRKKYSVKCVGISRDDEVHVKDCEELSLKAGDDILIYGSRLDLRRFADSL